MKKTMKRHGSPEAITTDGMRSYKAAMTDLGCAEKQEMGRWANNRAESRSSAQQPVREEVDARGRGPFMLP